MEHKLRALMLASLDGDAAAYRSLLTELAGHLRRYFKRRLTADLALHAEDLVQETLLAIHTRRSTYDPNRPFASWVYAIARYKLVDFLRRANRGRHVPIDDVADFLSSEADSALSASHQTELEAMLGTLPERTSGLIRRVKIEGQSVAEAAAATGLSETNVKVTVHRGLKALLARFGDKQ